MKEAFGLVVVVCCFTLAFLLFSRLQNFLSLHFSDFFFPTFNDAYVTGKYLKSIHAQICHYKGLSLYYSITESLELEETYNCHLVQLPLQWTEIPADRSGRSEPGPALP